MTRPLAPKKPTLAWLTLIFGAVFLIATAPASIVLLLVPFFKPDEISFMSSILTAFMLVLPAIAVWMMIRSYKAVKSYQSVQKEAVLMAPEETSSAEEYNDSSKVRKPYWPWLVIAPGAVLLVISGPGALMFPIMPLFLAGMSTDSGHTPGYVPVLLLFGGYGLMICYGILVWRAIKILRSH